ncbi:MAG: Grx4 family monothiol glutaredoxin [Acidobacteriota bacterium]
MSRDVMAEIKEEVDNNKLLIYMKGSKDFPQCGFSMRTVNVLRELGRDFKDVNVLADPEKWQAVKTFSDWPTIPQVYVDGKFVGGCDIVNEMHAKGELAPMVDQAFGE